ncbi:MAG: FAD:protein FMN transferase [Firmicutes bacterium]|nr:FAD:protein FMN transferase [Bacillota bacterium]
MNERVRRIIAFVVAGTMFFGLVAFIIHNAVTSNRHLVMGAVWEDAFGNIDAVVQLYVPSTRELRNLDHNARQNRLHESNRDMLNQMGLSIRSINQQLSANPHRPRDTQNQNQQDIHSAYYNNDINRINRASAGEPVEVSTLTINILTRSLYYYKATNGAFNPATLPLTDIWMLSPRFMEGPIDNLRLQLAGFAHRNEEWFYLPVFGDDEYEAFFSQQAVIDHINPQSVPGFTRQVFTKRPPPQEWIDTIKSDNRLSFGDIILNVSDNPSATPHTVIKPNDYMQLDLGAIARGHTLQVLANIARTHGFNSGAIDIGGDVYMLGNDIYHRSPWSLNIESPYLIDNTRFVIVNASVYNTAAATSGTHQRKFTYTCDTNGQTNTEFHHIIDASIGAPAITNLVSATVIVDDGIKAEALSTAAIVMGKEAAVKMLREAGVKAVLMHTNGNIYVVGELAVNFNAHFPQSARANHNIIHLDGAPTSNTDWRVIAILIVSFSAIITLIVVAVVRHKRRKRRKHL